MGRHPRRINELLSNETPLKALLTQSRANQALLKKVQNLLPSPLNEHCVATVLKGNQLLVYVTSSAWSSKLRYLSKNLCNELQRSGLEVTKVTVRVHLKKLSAHKKRDPVRKLSSNNASLISETARNITDPKLRDALERLSRHGRKPKD